MKELYFFPGETKIKKRTVYNWNYKINSKTVKSGTSTGKVMESLPQFKHHNVATLHEFSFKVANT